MAEEAAGWKLAVLKRRRQFLADWLEDQRSDGKMHYKGTKHDQREFEALSWAIEALEPLVPA